LLCCPFGEATRQEPEVPAARRPAWQVGETRVSRVIEPYPEELLQELVALLTHRQVWIKASQQRRPRSGIGPPRPELAHAGLAVQVVPEEDLVRALASEDHFGAARTHQATQQPERRRGRTKQNLLRMSRNRWQQLPDLARADDHRTMAGGEPGGHLILEGALVEARICEGDRERPQRASELRLGNAAQKTRVEPAGEKGRDGNVCTQAQPHRVLEQRAQLLLRACRVELGARLDAQVEVPVAPGLETAFPPAPHRRGWQLRDTLECRPGQDR